MAAKLQTQINKLFEGRTFEDRKVEWMDTLYPRVNSEEYHKFRKVNGLTHHDYTVKVVAGRLAGKKAGRDEIINDLKANYINRSWKPNELDVQIAQYLGQLTFRGWSGLINSIQKVIEGRN